jgi:hypothetical protein
MSRTDKDAPWWVRSEWWVPDHHRCENSLRTYGREPRVCDLPAEPIRKDRSHPRRYWDQLQTCTWEAEWLDRNRYNYTRPPTKLERHLGWYGPARAQLRMMRQEARKQYHGSGEIDVPELPWPRHSSFKGWWD